MTVFSWLHLTDFHYGMEEQDWLWPQFKQKFFDDLNLLHKECGPWDLVVFTGDITNEGLPEQFEGVNKILDDLWEHFNKLDFSPKLFVIPGNHDLTRPSDSSSTDFLNQWRNQIEKKKEFWRDEKSENRQFVNKIFKNYLAWFNENSQIEKNICKGMLPGDFSFTLEKSGTKLGIIGLNTSFLNLEDNMEGKLALHTKQFHAVTMKNGSSWVRKHHACLLLTHHPPMWLDEESQEHLHGEISSNRNFVVHLCGHTHHIKYKSASEDGADVQRHWQSRSLFGLNYFLDKNRDKIDRSHGYTVGKIELKKEKGNLTFWPRQAQIQGRERSIVPDHSVKLVKGDHTKPIQFKLHQPCDDSLKRNDRYGKKINIFSLKLSSLIKESICDHQQQIVEYIFEATTKNINLQNNLNSTDNQSLLRICREFDQFLVDKLRKAFNTIKEQLQKYYRLRDENIFGNHKIQPRVCFKTYRSEDRHICDIFRNSISPFSIDKNIGFIRVTEDRKFYICRNIPEEAKAGTYTNSRLIKNRVKQYELVEKKDYFENGNDIEWIKCWRGYGRSQKASADSCYKSTLIIPVSLVYDKINDFVAKRLKIDEAFDGTLFGYLCLDHKCQYYFSEDRPDVSMGYILADMLSLYMIARISYITSSPYKQVLSKLRESGLTLNDPLYKSSTL